MRRLLRRLVNGLGKALCLFSLLACVATAWVWRHSRRAAAADLICWRTNAPDGSEWRVRSFRTARGGFQVEDYRLLLRRRQFYESYLALLRDSRGFSLSHPEFYDLPDWTMPVCERRHSLEERNEWPDIGQVPRPQLYFDVREDAAYRNTWRGAVVPYRAAVAALALPPAAWLLGRGWRVLLLRRRRRLGLCPKCGYNLTGNSSGVCSECGNKIEAAPVERRVTA